MRNLFCDDFKTDKKYLMAFGITVFCAIICGIVLYKPVTINSYFRDFADEYVNNVYNFRNTKLILSRLISDLIYLYVIFAISYFTKFKYLSLILIFLKGLFFGVYSAVLIVACSFGGSIVAAFVFIPISLISLAACFAVSEFCKCINKKYILFAPAVVALLILIAYLLLINVLLRVIIIIV